MRYLILYIVGFLISVFIFTVRAVIMERHPDEAPFEVLFLSFSWPISWLICSAISLGIYLRDRE